MNSLPASICRTLRFCPATGQLRVREASHSPACLSIRRWSKSNLDPTTFGRTMRETGGTMKRLILVFCLGAVIAAAPASASPDPRVCSFSKAALCGKAFATSMVRRKLSGDGSLHWDGVIACRGLAGLLQYVCTYSNGNGKGVARVVFAPAPSFKPSVTVTPS